MSLRLPEYPSDPAALGRCIRVLLGTLSGLLSRTVQDRVGDVFISVWGAKERDWRAFFGGIVSDKIPAVTVTISNFLLFL